MSRSDIDYYARRAEEERGAAERCLNPQAARIHAELARRYARLARQSSPASV